MKDSQIHSRPRCWPQTIHDCKVLCVWQWHELKFVVVFFFWNGCKFLIYKNFMKKCCDKKRVKLDHLCGNGFCWWINKSLPHGFYPFKNVHILFAGALQRRMYHWDKYIVTSDKKKMQNISVQSK